MQLNKRQARAADMINGFLLDPPVDRLAAVLLMGPAGSGKTSVITTVFHKSTLRIAFCAFTNKATQVLKNISEKFGVVFNARFMTIHKLLSLKIKYTRYGELRYVFDPDACDITTYDVVICDECSTISTELFEFINSADCLARMRGVHVKFIFIGDQWQLPPVGENASVVFTRPWPRAELQTVMRSENDVILSINQNLIATEINREFLDKFPHNVIPKSCFLFGDDFISKLVKYYEKQRDVMCITYTVKNCEVINGTVQRLLNANAGRPDLAFGFYPGDKCCLTSVFEVVPLFERDGIYHQGVDTFRALPTGHTPSQSPSQSPGDLPDTCLYNGVSYDVVDAQFVKFKTLLNTLSYTPPHLAGQLVTLRQPGKKPTYTLAHIDPTDCLALIGARESRKRFLSYRAAFYETYPVLTPGYCITLYKSQGSEYQTCFVNLLSIMYSCKEAKQLYSAVYSAVSRASTRLYVKWA
jgi:hypothetical protein